MEAEALIAQMLTGVVGARPILLCGSRATGEANEGSDYDVVVVLPAWVAAARARRLARTGELLGRRLGVEVSVNPLVSVRVRGHRRNLLAWKIVRDGRVLAAPPSYRPTREVLPPLTERSICSLLLSAVAYLISHLQLSELSQGTLGPRTERGTRKALTHLAQLRLLRTGRYEPRLDDALRRLGHHRLVELSLALDRPEGWFGVRDLVLDELRAVSPPGGMIAALIGNTQYVLVSGLRGRSRWRAAGQGGHLERRLATAMVALCLAVRPRGLVDPAQLRAGRAALPRPLRPTGIGWAQLRDVVIDEWPNAHPLL